MGLIYAKVNMPSCSDLRKLFAFPRSLSLMHRKIFSAEMKTRKSTFFICPDIHQRRHLSIFQDASEKVQ